MYFVHKLLVRISITLTTVSHTSYFLWYFTVISFATTSLHMKWKKTWAVTCVKFWRTFFEIMYSFPFLFFNGWMRHSASSHLLLSFLKGHCADRIRSMVVQLFIRIASHQTWPISHPLHTTQSLTSLVPSQCQACHKTDPTSFTILICTFEVTSWSRVWKYDPVHFQNSKSSVRKFPSLHLQNNWLYTANSRSCSEFPQRDGITNIIYIKGLSQHIIMKTGKKLVSLISFYSQIFGSETSIISWSPPWKVSKHEPKHTFSNSFILNPSSLFRHTTDLLTNKHTTQYSSK